MLKEGDGTSRRAFSRGFARMCWESWLGGDVTAAILLVNNSTDTVWFQEAALVAEAVCFTRGRIHFDTMVGTSGSPTQGQAFLYFGPYVALFVERFSELGLVMRRCEA